jgi:broad specificity phosphatase PhoE
MSVELVFETHSTSTDNEHGIATGWLPGALSETGRRQAAELGRRRRAEPVAAVFCSDLRRATETAEIAFRGSGIVIYRDARLRECNYGDLNGMPRTRVEAERSLHIETPFPGGQSYRQVVAHVRGFLDDLAREWDDTRVVVIGHSATGWALAHLLQARPLEELIAAPPPWQAGWRYILT